MAESGPGTGYSWYPGACPQPVHVCDLEGLSQDSQDPVFRDKSVSDPDNLYDPCFLIHLFSELTRPGNGTAAGMGAAGLR